MKNLFIPVLMILVAGLALVALASRYPKFTDLTAIEKLDATPLEDGQGDSKKLYEWWYAERQKYETPYFHLLDAGTGLVSLSLSLLAFLLVGRVKTVQDVVRLETPKNRTRFYFVANITWLSIIPSTIGYYVYTAARGDYPPWADTIFIPIMETAIACIVLLPFINLTLWVILRKANLPVNLWIWSNIHKTYSWLWSGVVGIIGVSILATGYEVIKHGDALTVPVLLLTLYLTLSLRAVIISKKMA